MIPAHDSPLAALAFSPNGTNVATASEKGTVIRVFHVSLNIYALKITLPHKRRSVFSA